MRGFGIPFSNTFIDCVKTLFLFFILLFDCLNIVMKEKKEKKKEKEKKKKKEKERKKEKKKKEKEHDVKHLSPVKKTEVLLSNQQ